MQRFLWTLSFVLLLTGLSMADDSSKPAPVSLENVVPPTANSAEEPIAAQFSLAKAAHFLDSAALDWQQSKKCFTCHTNVAYLMSRPMIGTDAPAFRDVRKYAEQQIGETWDKSGPRSDAEVVALAAAFALNDAPTRKLNPLTKKALDRMWTLQRETGDWKWPTGCGWPPMESDQHYGVTLAAIAVGAAPEEYIQTPAAQGGLDKIRTFLKANPPAHLHHKAMLLWASQTVPDLMPANDQQACITELLAAARPDGGWAFSILYPWKRGDKKEQDLERSEGYGTGFVIYVLRQAGVAADNPAIVKGVAWLKSHQRESGRWYTRSLNRDNKHFISHAGSAFAVMALAACGEK